MIKKLDKSQLNTIDNMLDIITYLINEKHTNIDKFNDYHNNLTKYIANSNNCLDFFTTINIFLISKLKSY